MKLLFNVGAAVSLLLVACGGFFAWKVIMFQGNLSRCIWCFASAFALSITLYVFCLRDRIAVLEKRMNSPSE